MVPDQGMEVKWSVYVLDYMRCRVSTGERL